MEVKDIIWFEKYEVIKKLADGGSGSLYLVRHKELNSLRVIKRIPRSPWSQSQFANEINSLKSSNTPNIPIIYDVEEDIEYFYIIEEYIEGESLKAYRLSRGNISESRIIDFAIQICKVIDTLHSRRESILYCDLKPENIIVCQGIVKLVDFGASMPQKGNEKRSRSFGTKGYASPEQYGLRKLDKRSDIYGIGGILYFLAMGEDYKGKKENLKRLEQKKTYSRPFRKLIWKCLRHYPIERYESVGQLQRQLFKLQNTQKKKEKALPYIIAVTGSQKRIGCTHISFMIAAGLNRSYGRALYVEAGNSQAVFPIWMEAGFLKGCPMARGQREKVLSKYPGYQFYIFDYGDMSGGEKSPERLQIYKTCAKYLVIAGLKPWEAMEKEAAPGLEREKLLFLANFSDSILFAKKCQRVSGEGKWLRVPYAPNPFKVKEDGIKELLEEILYEKKEKQKGEVIC